MGIFDMTKVGKKCGMKGIISTEEGIKCFEELGFTRPCAAIWAYNAKYDSKHCFGTCIKNYFAPYNGAAPQCKLNDCLDCDEVKSGPLFK